MALALAVAWTLVLTLTERHRAWLVLAGGMVAALLVVAGGEALVAGRPRLVTFHWQVAALSVAAGAVALLVAPTPQGRTSDDRELMAWTEYSAGTSTSTWRSPSPSARLAAADRLLRAPHQRCASGAPAVDTSTGRITTTVRPGTRPTECAASSGPGCGG